MKLVTLLFVGGNIQLEISEEQIAAIQEQWAIGSMLTIDEPSGAQTKVNSGHIVAMRISPL